MVRIVATVNRSAEHGLSRGDTKADPLTFGLRHPAPHPVRFFDLQGVLKAERRHGAASAYLAGVLFPEPSFDGAFVVVGVEQIMVDVPTRTPQLPCEPRAKSRCFGYPNILHADPSRYVRHRECCLTETSHGLVALV